MLAGESLTIYGDGKQTRDYVFVGDVARANVAASSATLPPVVDHDSRAFNVATSVQQSVLDLANAVGEVMGTKPKIDLAPARAGELNRSALDIAKAKSILGWSPQVSFNDGLRAVAEWFRAGAS
ncbi:MAG: GDP-mannose 4,6-dehydratase, partial [Gemmatimonadota bacterium]